MKRPLVASILAFILSSFISITCGKAVSVIGLTVFALLSFALIALTLIKKYHTSAFLSLVCSFVVLSFALTVFIHIPNMEKAKSYNGYSGEIVAEIIKLERREGYSKATVKTRNVGEDKFKAKIQLTTALIDENFSEGDVIKISGDIHTNFSSTLEYSSEKTFASRKIFLLMNVESIEPTDIPPNRFRALIDSFRQNASERLTAVDSTGLMAGLVLGNTNSISSDTDAIFKKLGLSHALAVSGMHLSILVMSLYMFLRKHSAGKYFLSIFCSFLTLLYMALTGFSFSIVRAGIMLIIYFMSLLFRRQNDSYTTLFSSALFITAENPWALYDIGFELSFFATLGILSFSSPFISKISELDVFENKLPEKGYRRFLIRYSRQISLDIIMTVSTTVSATVATLPLSLIYFKSVTVYSIFANLSILFVINLLLSLSAIYLLLSYSNAALLYLLLGDACSFLSLAVARMSKTLADIIPDPYRFSPESAETLAVFAGIVLIVFFIFFKRPSAILWVSVFVIASVVFASTYTSKRDREKVFITFSTSPSCRDVLVEEKNDVTLLSNAVDGTGYGALSQMLAYRNIFELDRAIFFVDNTISLEKIKAISNKCLIKEIIIVSSGDGIMSREKSELEKEFERVEYIYQSTLEPSSSIKVKKVNGAYIVLTVSKDDNAIVISHCFDKTLTPPLSLYKEAEGIVFFGECEFPPNVRPEEFYYCDISDSSFPKKHMKNTRDIEFGFIELDSNSVESTFYK